MKARELLEALRRADVRLEACGDRLRADAPKGVLTPELVARMRALKAELLELVRGDRRQGLALEDDDHHQGHHELGGRDEIAGRQPNAPGMRVRPEELQRLGGGWLEFLRYELLDRRSH